MKTISEQDIEESKEYLTTQLADPLYTFPKTPPEKTLEFLNAALGNLIASEPYLQEHPCYDQAVGSMSAILKDVLFALVEQDKKNGIVDGSLAD